MKTFKNYEIAQLKRTAANMDKMQTELNKKLAKVEELNKEIETLKTSLSKMEEPYMHITEGRHIMDLVHKEVIPQFNEDGSPKMDKDNKYQQKVTKWVFTEPVEENPIENNPNEEAQNDGNDDVFDGTSDTNFNTEL